MTGLQTMCVLALSAGLLVYGPGQVEAEQTVPCGTQCLANYRACLFYGGDQGTCELSLQLCMNACNQS